MAGTLSPIPSRFWTFVDADGVPLAGYWLWTYAAQTTTPATTWTDIGMTVANTNPIVLNSAGRPPQPIYLPAATFKYIITVAGGSPLSPYLTEDNIPSTGLASVTVGSTVNWLGGDPNSPITATAIPSGTTFDKCAAGSSWVFIDSANLAGTFALEGMMLASAGTVTASLVNLTDGAPDTPLVSISSTSTTGDRQRSTAITFASGGSSKVYALKSWHSTGAPDYGLVWGCNLMRLT